MLLSYKSLETFAKVKKVIKCKKFLSFMDEIKRKQLLFGQKNNQKTQTLYLMHMNVLLACMYVHHIYS